MSKPSKNASLSLMEKLDIIDERVKIYLNALGQIATYRKCDGKDCKFCKSNGEHPFSHEAVIAQEAIESARRK